MDATDDGILTALELAALDLTRTELLVLSACETGLGKSAGGEGLLGLQRSCQIAGAGCVVSSLWQVDDERTSVLMQRFYENLWSGEAKSKLQSLRQAQLAVLRGEILSTSSTLRGPGEARRTVKDQAPRIPPSAWAAWVLSGDWR
jgi:CHAT domain-containing protein